MTVDGAIDPGSVPDDAAFSLFFRMIDQGTTLRERTQLRAYINSMYSTVERAPQVATTPASRDLQRQRADRLIQFMESHKVEIDRIEASKRMDTAYATRRASLVAAMRNDLIAHLGAQDALIVEQFVREVVKRRIRAYGR